MANNDKFLDLGYQKGRSEQPAKKRPKKQKAQAASSSNSSSSSDLIRITGLWPNRSGNGFSGLVSPSCKLLILENKHREKESDPPFIAFWAASAKQAEDEEHPF